MRDLRDRMKSVFSQRKFFVILFLAAALFAGVWGFRAYQQQQLRPKGDGINIVLDDSWVDLCYTIRIGNSPFQRRAHAPSELNRQLGSEMGRLVISHMTNKWSTVLAAKADRLPEARAFIIKIAKRYGYILKFGDDSTFDPRLIPGWKPEKWSLDPEKWAKLDKENSD